ncbi:MAG: Orn/Lys/Arg decarboxylase N-terminal domain-containing protein [Amphritea sp.]|nr:Orn/Lys/Arg decarboxylase N-terminal domain-containing protein [Amphritea sp.]
MHRNERVLLIANDSISQGHPASDALFRLGDAVKDLGYHVSHASSALDGLALLGAHPDFAAIGLYWDQEDETSFPLNIAMDIIKTVRSKNSRVPIFVITYRSSVSSLPLEVMREVREYVYLLSDTPTFIANRVDLAARQYYDQLLPPFFKTLKKFTEDGDYYWDCPGHMGGVAYSKHPVGAEFLKFFGENMMRADIGVATGEMGDYLEHVGPPRESEEKAAALFGADWSVYCVGGSSASNRIVTQGIIGEGEISITDRNCHKSLNHGLTLAHAHPVYLKPTRNGYGMVGPIPPRRFEPDFIRELIANSPVAQRAVSDEPSYAVVTNCTYDGFCYDVDAVVEKLGKSAPRLHFDEAWFAYAKFHPLYRGRFGMDASAEGPDRPSIFAVQSTHKMLPALSMASMIHVKESERAPLAFNDFNDAFMMHGTTSPYYPIIASIDVAVSMMSGRSGFTLVQESIEDAIGFRKAVVSVARQIKEEDGENEWFFDVFQPAEVIDPATSQTFSFEDAPVSLLSGEPSCWILRGDESWHGFTNDDIGEANCLLDPVKVTITCPGIEADGKFEPTGIPGYVLTKFLDARRTEIARTGDYTVLILFSVGTAKGKWGSMVESLLEFKRLFDNDARAIDAIPGLAAASPRYAAMTLKELCFAMHDKMRELNIPELLEQAVETDPEPVYTPAEAFQKVVRYKAEAVRVRDFPGRIAASMLVPYPPGIPVLMPGERLPEGKSPIVDYLLSLQEFGKAFPGFEHEVHGIHTDDEGEFWVRAIVEGDRVANRTDVSFRYVQSSAIKKGRQ